MKLDYAKQTTEDLILHVELLESKINNAKESFNNTKLPMFKGVIKSLTLEVNRIQSIINERD